LTRINFKIGEFSFYPLAASLYPLPLPKKKIHIEWKGDSTGGGEKKRHKISTWKGTAERRNIRNPVKPRCCSTLFAIF
jgi:hypothetical protein